MKPDFRAKAIVAAMVCGFLGGCDDDGAMNWSRAKDVEGATTITSDVRGAGGALSVALRCPGANQSSWGTTPSAEMIFAYKDDSSGRTAMLHNAVEITTADGTTRRFAAQRGNHGTLSVRFVGGPPPEAVAPLLGEVPHAHSIGDAKSITFRLELDDGRQIEATLRSSNTRFSAFVAKCQERGIMLASEPTPSTRETTAAAMDAIRNALAPISPQTHPVFDDLNVAIPDVTFDANGAAAGLAILFPKLPLATKLIGHTQRWNPFAFARRFPVGERFTARIAYFAQKDGLGGWKVQASVDPSEFSALRKAGPDDGTLPELNSEEGFRAIQEADREDAAETAKRKPGSETPPR